MQTKHIGFITFAIRIRKTNIGVIAFAIGTNPDNNKNCGFIAFAIRMNRNKQKTHIGFIAFAERIGFIASAIRIIRNKQNKTLVL